MTKPAVSKLKDDSFYLVKLARSITILGKKRPTMGQLRLRGTQVKEHYDDIAEITPTR